jgi:hypothetical protein
MTPPTALMPRIGTNIFVIIAGGKLSRIPMESPISHPEHGMSIRMITKPMANRLKNAPSSAARLSGKDIGSIDSTVSAPNAKPHKFAKAKRDIFSSLECLMSETSQFQRSVIRGSASAKIAFAFDFQEK